MRPDQFCATRAQFDAKACGFKIKNVKILMPQSGPRPRDLKNLQSISKSVANLVSPRKPKKSEKPAEASEP